MSPENQATYRRFASTEDSVPLYHQPWWLDTLCGEANWGVALAGSPENIKGALPYRQRRVRGLTILGQPPLTQWLGPWLYLPKAGAYRSHTNEQAALEELQDRLPLHNVYRQSWAPEVANWLPFFWAGYHETTYFTFLLERSSDPEKLLGGYSQGHRQQVIRSLKAGLRVEEVHDPGVLIGMNEALMRSIGRTAEVDGATLRPLVHEAQERKQGGVYHVVDSDQRVHAAAFLARDTTRVYYLMGASEPSLRKSGGMTLLLHWAASNPSWPQELLDFEGSTIRGVESFFRSFGGTRTMYSHVWRGRPQILDKYLTFRIQG